MLKILTYEKKFLTSISSILGYLTLKNFDSKIDPYTRFSLGLSASLPFCFSENQVYRNVAVGLGIASFLQLYDIKKGGKIIRNDSLQPIFVLDETNGISEIQPGYLPSTPIDGFTFKGLQAVFKVSDGIYVELNRDKSICYSAGIGPFINQNLRNGGLKSKEWVAMQSDRRWIELFKKSI